MTAVVLATVLTGSLWLALRPPRWLGVNLGDAIWWTLGTPALWARPFGVLGAAAGSARPRRRRLAG